MRPLTDHIPKNIVPLCGTPFLTYQIHLLKKAGVREIVFSIGYRPKDIHKVYGNGKKLGVRIHYALEKAPLGTAGAIKNAERYVKGSAVVVLNGDILTDLPLARMIAFHRKNRHLATLGLVRVEDPTPYGLVLLDGKSRIRKFLEKPSAEEAVTDTINAGVYVFEGGVFDFIPPGVNHSAERNLFPHLLRAQAAFGGFTWKGYWQDLGTPRKYLTTHWEVLGGAFPVFGKYRRKNGVHWGKGIKVEKGARVEGPAIIGDGCVIHKDAKVMPYSTLGKKCVVGEGAVIAKSVLWDGARIGRGVHLIESVLGRKARIPDFTHAPKDTVLGDGEKL